MRGQVDSQGALFNDFSVEEQIAANYPLRWVKVQADVVLDAMSAQFDALYATLGPVLHCAAAALKATLLIAFYSVHSDRLFCEMPDDNLLFSLVAGEG